MKPTRNVIRDKATKKGYLAPVEGIHEGLEFEFRPMIPEQVEALHDRIAQTKIPGESMRLIAAAMVLQLVTWSEVDDNGGPRPIDLGTVSRLPRPLLLDMKGIITGVAASDLKPDATTGEVKRFMEELAPLPGLAEQEQQTKN